MFWGKNKQKIEMLEKVVDALGRSIEDLTAEVNVLRKEVEDLKKSKKREH